VHVFEEDSAAGQVYKPETSAVPLSRRPRRRFALHRDGSAVLYAPGPDDRFVQRPARWTAEGDQLILQATNAERGLRILSRTPERLVVSSS
jgi:hypothetical protein